MFPPFTNQLEFQEPRPWRRHPGEVQDLGGPRPGKAGRSAFWNPGGPRAPLRYPRRRRQSPFGKAGRKLLQRRGAGELLPQAKPHWGSAQRPSFKSKATDLSPPLLQSRAGHRGWSGSERTGAGRRYSVSPLGANTHLTKPPREGAGEGFLAQPVSELLNHFLLSCCGSGLEITKSLGVSPPGPASCEPTSERAGRTALAAGAAPGPAARHPRGQLGDAAGRGGPGGDPRGQSAARRAPAYPRVLMKPLTEPSAYRDTMSPM